MNNMTMALVALIGTAAAVSSDLPDQLRRIYDDSVEAAQLVATAGDLHSMSVMLDAGYIMNRRLPGEEEFSRWLTETFKENNVKELAVDHWGTPYRYTVLENGRGYRVRSAGVDTVFDTADDMVKTGP
jgi:general secretion pathway protein G